jgi:glycogen debranching enzyme
MTASGVGDFPVPASTSLQERRIQSLKHGDMFAVFGRDGDLYAAPDSPDGLYFRDTRYLSGFELQVEDRLPLLLSATLRDDNAVFTCDLTNPDLLKAGGAPIEHNQLHFRRSRFLWSGKCFERIAIRNFDIAARAVRVRLRFTADFADLFEVRGTRRDRRGRDNEPVVSRDSVQLCYTGLDDKVRTTRLRFSPAPVKLTASYAEFELALMPHGMALIFSEIACDPAAEEFAPDRAFYVAFRAARRERREAAARAASISSSSQFFDEVVRRSAADLGMLTTQTGSGSFPYAGIPWFSTAFGRDAIITALQVLWLDPSIARGVLLYLAANQAKETNAAADAEPGKILHEVRHGEMAELNEVPFRRYYGSVDATPLFILLAGAYLKRTGDLATIRDIWPNIRAALAWIAMHGDRDGDGFVEYGRQTKEGLVNQAWKDSHDSVFLESGELASGPVAIVEVQAYVYGAWRAAAGMAANLGQAGYAEELERKAASFQRDFDNAFWDEALGTYVLALDGQKRACRVRSSNAGHVLFTGLALPQRSPQLRRTLMSKESFSGWGIRTLATSEPRYNPMSYHNGSVWPHDNAIVAAGLARYGFKRDAERIFAGLFAASTYIEFRRLPELFCGFNRQRNSGPTAYPVACSPQAWSAVTPFLLLQACLGLTFDCAAQTITFDQPRLPAFLKELVIRNMSLGSARVDVALRRAGAEVGMHVLSRTGETRVVTIS